MGSIEKHLAVKATGLTIPLIKFSQSDASHKLRATYESRTQATRMSQRFRNVTLFCPLHITRRGRLEVGSEVEYRGRETLPSTALSLSLFFRWYKMRVHDVKSRIRK